MVGELVQAPGRPYEIGQSQNQPFITMLSAYNTRTRLETPGAAAGVWLGCDCRGNRLASPAGTTGRISRRRRLDTPPWHSKADYWV